MAKKYTQLTLFKRTIEVVKPKFQSALLEYYDKIPLLIISKTLYRGILNEYKFHIHFSKTIKIQTHGQN